MEGKERQKKEAGLSRQVGGEFKKWENLLIRFVLGASRQVDLTGSQSLKSL